MEIAFRLEIKQTPDQYIFNRIPCWNTVTKDGKTVSNQEFGDFSMRVALGESGEKTAVIAKYLGNDIEVIVPEEIKGYQITGFAAGVFKNNTTLQQVTLPAGIQTVSDETFYGCTALRRVILPDSVTAIGKSAFYGCTLLVDITIPDDVKK